MSGIPSPSRSSSSLTSTLAGSPFGGIFPDGFSMRVWISFVSFFFIPLPLVPPSRRSPCMRIPRVRTQSGRNASSSAKTYPPSSATRAVPPFNAALQRRPSTPPFNAALQRCPSTPPFNTALQHRPSTPPFNTALQHRPSTPPFNTALQHRPSTPPFNTALQHRPSTPPFPKSLNEFRAGDRRASRESPIPDFAKFPLLKFPLRVLHRAVGRCAEPAPASNADTPR